MAHASGEIVELRWESGRTGACLRLPAEMTPAPGQYLLGYAAAQRDVLPAALFPAGLPEELGLPIAPGLPEDWGVGAQIALRGPLGKGFSLPPDARQVALAALSPVAARLLPLAQMALMQGAAVVLYAAQPPALLPPDVEVLPLDELPGALPWADYLAVDVPRAQLSELPARLGGNLYRALRQPAQALVVTSMPCAGVAECGICAVPLSSGVKLACKDGPVFSLLDLIL